MTRSWINGDSPGHGGKKIKSIKKWYKIRFAVFPGIVFFSIWKKDHIFFKYFYPLRIKREKIKKHIKYFFFFRFSLKKNVTDCLNLS